MSMEVNEGGSGMFGAITKREIIAHPVVTVQCFGWPLFIRALMAPHDATFLSLLTDLPYKRSHANDRTWAVINRAIDLELAAHQIYARLAVRFASEHQVAQLFRRLSHDEQHHADLLKLCQEIAPRAGVLEHSMEEANLLIDKSEPIFQAFAQRASKVSNATDALRLAIELESSEINPAFDAIVAATDSNFVRRLRKFHLSGTSHIAFLSHRIKDIAPDLVEECRQLAACRGQVANK